jgi:hypothetical protein
MGDFFTSILDKINAALAWFGSLFVNLFVALWDLIRDAFTWLFDSAMGVGASAVNAIDVSGLSTALSGSAIPANVMLVLSCIGFGQALALISTALVIRFTLQLIPFIRLGS